MAQTHKSMIYQAGYDRGQAVASWINTPEIGVEYWTESEGRIVATRENAADVWFSCCYDAESNGRQYTPFEFTAKELNDLQEEKKYDVWDTFEAGIEAGFIAEWKTRSLD